MRRILLVSLCALFMSANGAFAYGRYEAPNGGNINFYPLMQYQLEQQETLDFKNNPEEYKQKREAKDLQDGTIVRKQTYNPSYSPNYGGTGLQQTHPVNMFFTKDADGNIKIQGMNSIINSGTIDTAK